MQFYNKVSNYADVDFKALSRVNFLQTEHYLEVSKKIKDKSPLLFLPTYLFETHLQDAKYSKSCYKIVLVGILSDGRKATVVLNDIRPYFEVRIPTEDNEGLVKDPNGKKCTPQQFKENLIAKINKEEISTPTKTSVFKAKPFKYYQEHLNEWVRFYYIKTSHKSKANRQAAIKYIRDAGYETATDDLNNYYRVVCRDYLTSFSTWVELIKYDKADIDQLKGLVFSANIEDYIPYKKELPEILLKDKTVSLCWDIETWSPNGEEIPAYQNSEDRIFCIGMTFQFVNEKTPFLQIALCDVPSNGKPDHYTIVCGKESNLIECFGKIFSVIKPEYVFGFNDSDYDWKWLINRASCTTGLLSALADNMSIVNYGIIPFPALNDVNVLKYNLKNEQVKLEADSYADGYSLQMPGYIPVDVRTIFRKLYPTAEQSSLKFFLEENNIIGKDPMGYDRMHDNMQCYYDLQKHIEEQSIFDLTSKGKSPNKSQGKSPNKVQSIKSPGQSPNKGQLSKSSTKDFLLNLQVQTEEVYAVKLIKEMRRDNLYTKDKIEKITAVQVQCDKYKIFSKDNEQTEEEKQKEIKLICNDTYAKYTDLINKQKQKEQSLSYNELLAYKRDQLLKELADLCKYCIIDAKRCHDLLYDRSVIIDNKEVANLTYVNIYDGFYRAQGMKVRNLTIAEGQQKPFNIRFSNMTNKEFEEGKFPGAFVFPPKKGLKISKLSLDERVKKAELTKDKKVPACVEWLNTTQEELSNFKAIVKEYGPVQNTESIAKIETEKKCKLTKKFKDFLLEGTDRPVAGLDFSSLYPSLMRAYNFSPDYCVLNKKYAKSLHDRGEKLTKVDFDFNGQRKVGYFLWHNNEYSKTNADGTPNEKFKFGVYPYVLNDLFNKRADMKKKLKQVDHQLEELKKEPAKIKEGGENFNLWENTNFTRNYINCKQNILKVFMNTFYGVAGMAISPFFVIEVAGGVTSYGKKNIKLAYDFILSKNCKIYYGDTDSIYLSVQEKAFEQIDKEYYSGEINKLSYWEKMVNISFQQIEFLKTMVNDMFYIDNNTKFLQMAFEEFLFPVIFVAKKKYFGIKHENGPNFDYIALLDKTIEYLMSSKKLDFLFVRGLDVKKRGISHITKLIINYIMVTCCDPNNLFDLIELSLNQIDLIYKTEWKVTDFIQTDVYRPKKNNIKVKTFVARMAEQNIIIKANERFKYVVVVKYPYTYSLRGCKNTLSVGDKIELVEEFIKNGYKIDLDHYVEKSISGAVARLITYHDMFYVEPVNDSPKELKEAEDKIYKHACKYIDEYCKVYFAQYNSFGGVYQKIFKTANSVISEKIKRTDSLASKLLSANVDLDKLESWIISKAEAEALKIDENYGKKYVEDQLDKIIIYTNNTHDQKQEIDKLATKKARSKKIAELQRAFYGTKNSILPIREASFKETMSILRAKLKDYLDDFIKLYKIYQNGVQILVNKIKDQINLSDDLFNPIDDKKDYKFDDLDVEIDEDILDVEASKYTNTMMKDPKIEDLLGKFKTIHLSIKAAYLILYRTKNIVDYLNVKKNTLCRIISEPNNIKDIINKSIEDSMDQPFNF